MNRIFKYYKNRKGITLVLMAFMLAVLLMLAGLAIDIAYMYYVKNQLQVAADASALAGAGELIGTGTAQEKARRAAWKFACKNKAAGANVYLINNFGQPTDIFNEQNCNIADTLLANQLTDGDIFVGKWDGGDCVGLGSESETPDCVKADARRTADSPGGSVRVFIGQIFRIINADWSFMSARARAIASRAPLATPAIPLCIPSCNLSVPHDLIIQKDPKKIPINDGMAWTAFDYKQAPNIGKNGDVVDYIWGRKKVQIMCNLCVTTNNAPGEALKELDDAFTSTTYKSADKDFDNSGKVIRWRVAVPILDMRCNPDASNLDCPNLPEPPSTCPPDCASCACPPGGQGNTSERYHIAQMATITITKVRASGSGSNRGITIDSIECVGCPTSVPLGKGVALVK